MRRSAPRQPSRSPRTTTSHRQARAPAEAGMRRLCAIREGPPRQFPSTLSGERARLIIMHADKWVNGTVVKYAFFEPKEPLHAVVGDGHPARSGPEGLPALHGPGDRRPVRAGGGSRERAGAHRIRGRGRPLVVRRATGTQAGGGRPHDEPRPDGPHLERGLRRRRRDPRDRPHPRLPPRAPESERRHRLGRGSRVPGARRAAQQLVSRDDVPQHHQEDPAGPGPGLVLGSRLDHALPVRAGPDPGARAIPAGPQAGRTVCHRATTSGCTRSILR